MKKIICIAAVLIANMNSFAQGVDDSTSMQQFYTNQVFYSLNNGEVANIDNTDWNIAFSLSGNGALGSSILLNEANSTLWQAPNDTTAWATLDSTGHANWSQLLNSDSEWKNGAFNTYRGGVSFFDLGWGSLDPANNYWTLGDSLYIIKLGDNSYKKLWIKSLKSGVWNFTYANMDGSNENSMTITKTDYTNKNFIYVSLENGTILDREPDNTTWDIMWAKHTDFVNPPGMYIGVTSVFNNVGLWTARSDEADLSAALSATTPQTAYTQDAINIGRTWKRRVQGQWVVNDSIAYFAWNKDSTDLFRIVFTDFGGISDGKSYFNIEKLGTVGVENSNVDVQFSLFPNPSTNQVTVKIDNANNNQLVFNVFTVNGKLVSQSNIIGNSKSIDISYLPNGLYIYQLIGENINITNKLLKQ